MGYKSATLNMYCKFEIQREEREEHMTSDLPIPQKRIALPVSDAHVLRLAFFLAAE